MPLSLSGSLLNREIHDPYRWSNKGSQSKGVSGRNSSVRGLYSNKRWINDLDIVNELGGHKGCVNALSWSKSGKFLVSGSDDTHLNIYRYDSESTTDPFVLSTTIATGHTQNIFSVKFMPGSSDKTCVSAAGDHQVRVFDIEHSVQAGYAPSQSSASYAGLENLYRGVQFLSPSTTNGRVYRSHSDRVKRIVTESSPHLFLTCSEDGTVRQWDLRLPSSAYPSPRRGDSVPPPLINYRPYRLDLNSISCSASQPHYIVLGGANPMAFLHDRRMLGRDTDSERGSTPNVSASMSPAEEEYMSKATKCVRRFAPNGKPGETGHITACKISDARPNEMLVSWSGDHIYAFNLVSSPDARELERGEGQNSQSRDRHKTVSLNSRKRKRRQTVDVDNTGTVGGTPEQARPDLSDDRNTDVALRVRYGNGQTEDIPLQTRSNSTASRAEDSPTRQPRTLVAKGVNKIRQRLFSLEPNDNDNSPPLTKHVASFSDALSCAATILPEMESISSAWTYPILPDAETVTHQNALRRNRAASCRFVETAGALSLALFKASNPTEIPISAERFNSVEGEAPSQPGSIPMQGSTYQRFCYLFLAAIIAWLNGDRAGLLEWSKPHGRHPGHFDVAQDEGEEAILDKIIPGLFALANKQERAIINVDASRFEVDNNRILFAKGADAVLAFSNAVYPPFKKRSNALNQDRRSASSPNTSTTTPWQSKADATTTWAFKVGRGLLLSAGEGINYAFVNRAFGGRGRGTAYEGRNQRDVDSEVEEHVESVRRMRYDHESGGLVPFDTDSNLADEGELDELVDDDDIIGIDSDEDSDEEDDEDAAMEYSDDNDEFGYSDADGLDPLFGPSRSVYTNRKLVEKDVPCTSHTRVYRGHCNVKTVKDVNFFGKDDEYVVSGSDCGNLFIWDRKTGELVNILRGDSDIVNVVQGHPYEPLLAVSGIDHTIKIFSPDQRAQAEVRRGNNIASSRNGSAGMSRIRRHRRQSQAVVVNPDAYAEADYLGVDPITQSAKSYWDDEDIADEPASNGGLKSCRRMHESYQIMSQNELDREGSEEETLLSRTMLLHYLAASRMHARRNVAAQGDGNGDDGDEEPIVLDENRTIM